MSVNKIEDICPSTFFNFSFLIFLKRHSLFNIPWRPAILICMVSILCISCGDNGPIDYRTRKFIEKEYSEARVIEDIFHEDSQVEILDKLEFDFNKMKAPNGILFGDVKYKPGHEGLEIFSKTKDPRMVFVNRKMKYNKVEIELKSGVTGVLKLFWAKSDEHFQEKWSKKKRISESDVFKKYSIDLSLELNPGLNEYRFRLDPIDKKEDLTIKSITFYRVHHAIPSIFKARDVMAGKVEIANETREAFVMQSSRKVEKTFRIYKGDVLDFGLGKFKNNDIDCVFQIFLEQEGKEKIILFDKKLAANENNAWADYTLDLSNYAGKDCKITLAVKPIGNNKKTGLVFCANPRIQQPPGKNGAKPNIILISIDTLGARHLTLYGGMRNTDPFLKELARQGVVFKNAFANSSVTHISHASMLTGMEPLNFDILFSEDDEFLTRSTTLAEILRGTGYLTTAFTGGVLVAERLSFDKGFELFYQEDTLYKDKDIDIELILQKALQWVKSNQGAPFFLFLHSYEPHGKYYKHEDFFKGEIDESIVTSEYEAFNLKHMPGEDELEPPEIWKYVTLWKGKLRKEDPRTTLGDVKYIEEIYDSEIAFIDFQLEQFFDGLRRQGALDNTIVVFTSDHGEAFFEHNLLQHGLLYDENLRVPLIFWGPGLLPANVSVDEYVSAVDIVPTILDLAGIEAQNSLDGNTLRRFIEEKENKAGHRFYCFVPDNGFSWYMGDRYKYILRTSIEKDNFGKKELFDLKKDPFEEKNLFSGMEKLPPALKTFVEDTIKLFPGIHISFADFADNFSGVFEIELIGVRNNVYGFGIEKIEFKPSHEQEKPGNVVYRIKLNRKSELVMFDHPDFEKISLSLKPIGANEEYLFSIPAGNLSIAKEPIKTNGTDKVLLAWEVKPKRKAVRKRLSPDEENKLRSLGYIQ